MRRMERSGNRRGPDRTRSDPLRPQNSSDRISYRAQSSAKNLGQITRPAESTKSESPRESRLPHAYLTPAVDGAPPVDHEVAQHPARVCCKEQQLS